MQTVWFTELLYGLYGFLEKTNWRHFNGPFHIPFPCLAYPPKVIISRDCVLTSYRRANTPHRHSDLGEAFAKLSAKGDRKREYFMLRKITQSRQLRSQVNRGPISFRGLQCACSSKLEWINGNYWSCRELTWRLSFKKEAIPRASSWMTPLYWQKGVPHRYYPSGEAVLTPLSGKLWF